MQKLDSKGKNTSLNLGYSSPSNMAKNSGLEASIKNRIYFSPFNRKAVPPLSYKGLPSASNGSKGTQSKSLDDKTVSNNFERY